MEVLHYNRNMINQHQMLIFAPQLKTFEIEFVVVLVKLKFKFLQLSGKMYNLEES